MDNHAEVTEGVTSIVSSMMMGMAEAKDLAAAEALEKQMPDWKAQMKGYLTAAKDLPEPTGAEKAAFVAKMGEINRAVGPAMLSMKGLWQVSNQLLV